MAMVQEGVVHGDGITLPLCAGVMGGGAAGWHNAEGSARASVQQVGVQGWTKSTEIIQHGQQDHSCLQGVQLNGRMKIYLLKNWKALCVTLKYYRATLCGLCLQNKNGLSQSAK